MKMKGLPSLSGDRNASLRASSSSFHAWKSSLYFSTADQSAPAILFRAALPNSISLASVGDRPRTLSIRNVAASTACSPSPPASVRAATTASTMSGCSPRSSVRRRSFSSSEASDRLIWLSTACQARSRSLYAWISFQFLLSADSTVSAVSA